MQMHNADNEDYNRNGARKEVTEATIARLMLRGENQTEVAMISEIIDIIGTDNADNYKRWKYFRN